ncbi:MAG: hypothetical protein E7J12_14360, partial [Eggerthella sp.]|nr:hypothetical protein [Eggerthella sp.]
AGALLCNGMTCMQAALIAWITIRLWTHFLAYNPPSRALKEKLRKQKQVRQLSSPDLHFFWSQRADSNR